MDYQINYQQSNQKVCYMKSYLLQPLICLNSYMAFLFHQGSQIE